MGLPSTSPGSAPFAQIAEAIRARVAAYFSIPDAYVRIVANDKYKVTVAEPMFSYIQFFKVGQPSDRNLSHANSGAGRIRRPVGRRFRVYLYSRSQEDIYGEDSTALAGYDPTQTVVTPPTLPGQFVLEEQLLDSLDDWMPLDSNSNPLALGPLHVMDDSGPPLRKPEDDSDGLIRTDCDFEVAYICAIKPTEPPT